jgi:hypothetical protein
MKNSYGIILITFMLSCNKKAEKAVIIDSNTAFEKYKEGFVKELWEIYLIGLTKVFIKGILVSDSVFKKKQLDFALQLDSFSVIL